MCSVCFSFIISRLSENTAPEVKHSLNHQIYLIRFLPLVVLVEAVMVQDFLWIRFCVWHQGFDLFGFSRLSLCSPLQAETSTGRSRDETTRCPPASSTSQVLSSISSSTLQSASPPSVHPPVRFICQSVYLSVSLLLSIHSFCPSDGQMINPSSIHPSTHLPICPTVTPSINPLSLCLSLRGGGWGCFDEEGEGGEKDCGDGQTDAGRVCQTGSGHRGVVRVQGEIRLCFTVVKKDLSPWNISLLTDPLSCRARWINSWRKPTWPWWSGPTPGGSSLLKPSQSALVRTDLSQVSVFLSVWPWLCLPLRSRWWRWRWMWRGEAALLFWLRHALPHCLLEASVRLRPSHRLLEWLGLLRRLYLSHRHADGSNRRPGITFRLHRRTQRLRHRCGVRGFGHICTRSDIKHHIRLAASVINSNFTI